jgi:F-type H+-transporting ATPase subunit gamma
MATLQEIRQRRQSVSSVEKIMSAMKVVAATKLKILEDAWLTLKKNRNYLSSILKLAAGNLDPYILAPFLHQRVDAPSALWVVIGADRGLCGGFGGNLVRLFKEKLRASGTTETRFIFIGKRLHFLKRLVPKDHVLMSEPFGRMPSQELVEKVMQQLIPEQDPQRFQACYVLSTHFQSALKQEAVFEPLGAPFFNYQERSPINIDTVLTEPDLKQFSNALTEVWTRAHLLTLLYESLVSEQGARLMAMESATRSSKELIDDLDLTYNRTRQALITKQLIEVVSGASR